MSGMINYLQKFVQLPICCFIVRGQENIWKAGVHNVYNEINHIKIYLRCSSAAFLFGLGRGIVMMRVFMEGRRGLRVVIDRRSNTCYRTKKGGGINAMRPKRNRIIGGPSHKFKKSQAETSIAGGLIYGRESAHASYSHASVLEVEK